MLSEQDIRPPEQVNYLARTTYYVDGQNIVLSEQNIMLSEPDN